jgi:hypothetical protein
MTSQQDWGASEPIMPQYYYGNYQKASEPKRNAGYNAWAGSIDSKIAGIGHPQEQFAKMKTNYVDKGYPVIVGEFGANVRSPELSGNDLNLHKQGRVQWHKDVVSAAKQYGLTPILWDMGNESNSGYDNMAYIRRQTSPVVKELETDVINAMRSVYNLGNYVNTGVTHVEDFITGRSENPATSSTTVVPPASCRSAIAPESSSNIALTSSSFTDPCDAMIPECGYMGFVDVVKNGLDAAITREGNLLRVNAASGIELFDMQGNLVRKVNAAGGTTATTMSLEGLHQGLYIAKSGKNRIKTAVK